MRQVLDILEDAVKAYGVQARRYDENLFGLAAFDEGLRSRLFENYDAGPLAESLRAIEPRAVYLIEDDNRYFTRLFKRQFGISPREYRAKKMSFF